MAGIYIHIPFCKQKCHYCNFFSVASAKYRKNFTDSLWKEIMLQKDYLEDEEIHSVYFGGGTPSLITPSEISNIIGELRKVHRINQSAEITVEANPDDLSKEYLKELYLSPVNRLSVGIQSFHQEDLIYLGRVHDAQQAMDCIHDALETGFINVSVDLIYGMPTLTSKNWINNLNRAASFGVPHISAYALTIEPKTAMHHFIKQEKIWPMTEEQVISHFNVLCDTLYRHGYQHYEISNFCKEGWYSRHNTGYWQGKKYLGLGPSAHSFNSHSRKWNIANLSQYVQSIGLGTVPCECEILTPVQKYNEYIMTSLRTMWGCDLSVIKSNFGEIYLTHFMSEIKDHLNSGMIIQEGRKVFLTRKGMLIADRIASDLFMTDEG
jgi:oxygen-independent coproporphyrinogen-3 oxidase